MGDKGDKQECDFPADRWKVSHVVVSKEQIAARVASLGEELAEFYCDKEVTILPVLTGAFVFAADLIRHLPLKLRIDPVSISSYTGKSLTPRECSYRLPPPEDITGRDVLIVDDIFDSGETMRFLTETVRNSGARSIRTCTLLRKLRKLRKMRKMRPDLPERKNVDFVGFDIQDEFVVGYGLDFDGFFRNLPDICILKKQTMEVAK